MGNVSHMLIEIARGNERVATALHESGHAVAYLSQGQTFRYITMNPRGSSAGMLQPHRQPIDALTKAITCMAGPAVEGLMFHHGTGNDIDVFTFVHRRHSESIAAAELDDESNDYTDAGQYAIFALPLSLALITANWASIERLATELLASPRAITYKQVLQLVGDRTVDVQSEHARWTDAAELFHEIEQR